VYKTTIYEQRRLSMAGKAGLKAGLIGAAVMFVITLLSLIPTLIPRASGLNCVCCGLEFLAFAGIGVLGGFFLTPPRDAGAGAGAGAIAGVVSGLVDGVLAMIVAAIQMAIRGGDIIAMLDPQQVRTLIDAGIDPEMLAIFSGWGGVAIGGGLCCIGYLVIGAALGAIGGAILAAVKSD
jgi:uncharacterized membrane protein